MLPFGPPERKEPATGDLRRGYNVPRAVPPPELSLFPRRRGSSFMPRKKTGKKTKPKVAGIVGVGLDGEDGHTRITRTEEMVLLGGSEETHERMQETAVKFGEGLEKRGKSLPETSLQEAVELLREAIERTGR
jgi:hypothetical protein